MTGIEFTIWCDNCGVEILWGPIVVGKLHYCCRDCLEGLQCKCSERMEMDDDRRDEGSSAAETSGSAYL
jgi:hypothetical protein